MCPCGRGNSCGLLILGCPLRGSGNGCGIAIRHGVNYDHLRFCCTSHITHTPRMHGRSVVDASELVGLAEQARVGRAREVRNPLHTAVILALRLQVVSGRLKDALCNPSAAQDVCIHPPARRQSTPQPRTGSRPQSAQSPSSPLPPAPAAPVRTRPCARAEGHWRPWPCALQFIVVVASRHFLLPTMHRQRATAHRCALPERWASVGPK